MIGFTVEARSRFAQMLRKVAVDEAMLTRDLRRRSARDLAPHAARLQQRHSVARGGKQISRRQADDAAADDDDIGSLRALQWRAAGRDCGGRPARFGTPGKRVHRPVSF